MTEKPEWFQLVDSDEQISDFVKPRRAGKRIPATAVLASLAIIVGGAFFANANGETSASAETTAVAAPVTPTDSTNPVATPATPRGGAASDTPAIGNLPQNGGHDDDQYGDGEGDDEMGDD